MLEEYMNSDDGSVSLTVIFITWALFKLVEARPWRWREDLFEKEIELDQARQKVPIRDLRAERRNHRILTAAYLELVVLILSAVALIFLVIVSFANIVYSDGSGPNNSTAGYWHIPPLLTCMLVFTHVQKGIEDTIKSH